MKLYDSLQELTPSELASIMVYSKDDTYYSILGEPFQSLEEAAKENLGILNQDVASFRTINEGHTPEVKPRKGNREIRDTNTVNVYSVRTGPLLKGNPNSEEIARMIQSYDGYLIHSEIYGGHLWLFCDLNHAKIARNRLRMEGITVYEIAELESQDNGMFRKIKDFG